MQKAKGSETIADKTATLELYNEAVDISTLHQEEQKALTNINKFWNSPDVYHHEKTLDIDKFYDVKEHHTILNGKHELDSIETVDLSWHCYIQKAMSHRLTLTAKVYTTFTQIELSL